MPPTPTADLVLMLSDADYQVLLSRRGQPMPYFVRHVDGDLPSFVHEGSGLLETEFGPLRHLREEARTLMSACAKKREH